MVNGPCRSGLVGGWGVQVLCRSSPFGKFEYKEPSAGDILLLLHTCDDSETSCSNFSRRTLSSLVAYMPQPHHRLHFEPFFFGKLFHGGPFQVLEQGLACAVLCWGGGGGGGGGGGRGSSPYATECALHIRSHWT